MKEDVETVLQRASEMGDRGLKMQEQKSFPRGVGQNDGWTNTIRRKQRKKEKYLDPGVLLLLRVGVHEEDALGRDDREGVLLLLVLAADGALLGQLDDTSKISILDFVRMGELGRLSGRIDAKKGRCAPTRGPDRWASIPQIMPSGRKKSANNREKTCGRE